MDIAARHKNRIKTPRISSRHSGVTPPLWERLDFRLEFLRRNRLLSGAPDDGAGINIRMALT